MINITETRELKSIRVISSSRATEVEWVDVVRRDDGTLIAETPFNRAYGRFDRAQFLADMADHPSAVTYADLAGLEPAANAPGVEPAA